MLRLVMGSGRWLLLLPLGVACGGVVEGGSKDPQDGTPSGAAAASSSNSSSSSDPGTDNPDADTDLGSCTLGPLENRATAQPCAWVADKRCYQTREMACNCACPRSRNSQCSSGFDDGPDGHVWVACN
ncbi:MAG: hypothetical protein ABUL60_23430 [Myxococcales bacterium]